jgi:hypothetical protein
MKATHSKFQTISHKSQDEKSTSEHKTTHSGGGSDTNNHKEQVSEQPSLTSLGKVAKGVNHSSI